MGHAMECDYHYLVMSEPEDVVKYSTRSDALAALHKLVAKHAAQGLTTRRSRSGRLCSYHPDGRTIEFWIDDANGDIVQPAGGSTAGETVALEINGPTPSIAAE
jgi:hypothetical protein